MNRLTTGCFALLVALLAIPFDVYAVGSSEAAQARTGSPFGKIASFAKSFAKKAVKAAGNMISAVVNKVVGEVIKKVPPAKPPSTEVCSLM